MRLVLLGYECNNACVFCAQGSLRMTTPFVSRADIERELSTLSSGESVAFVGGEPTLVDELPELVEAARARGASAVLVQTNARRLARTGLAERLLAAGVSGLDVSIAGSNAAMHDYHTGTPGSFAETVAGLRRARAASLPFGLSVVVTRGSYRHLSEIVRVAHTLGARAVRFALAEPVGRAREHATRIVPPLELVKPHLARALDLALSLDLGLVVRERAVPPEAREWFAGTGSVEAVPESV